MILEKPYDRERAVTYAETWALSRNPLFLNFAGRGGDCTNFISQCLLAGGATMNDTRDFGWYYFSPENRAPAWSGVEFLYNFLTGAPEYRQENGGEGPYARPVTFAQGLREGDIIQLANQAGDFYHTLIITAVTPDDFLVCAHTNDALVLEIDHGIGRSQINSDICTLHESYPFPMVSILFLTTCVLLVIHNIL